MLAFHESLTLTDGCERDRSYYTVDTGEKQLLTKWRFAYFDEWKEGLGDVCPEREIPVPSCWQMLGYDFHQYTNYRYPFPYMPPKILKKNPCGIYQTNYAVERKNGRYELCFTGVDSCLYLFVNNVYKGYASVSHSYHVFDVTDALVEGNNVLKAIVFKWNCGSYLEDQDKLRLSGIFGTVYMQRRTEGHLRDYKLSGDYDTATGTGKISFQADKPCTLRLSGEKIGVINASGSSYVFEIPDAIPWNAEKPYLYSLEIECGGEKISERVGLRRVCAENGVLMLNGNPVKLRGVNRHSFTVNGYVESEEDLKRDLKLLKECNVNAIRTSHYPPHPELPRLCDEMGFYLMVEADVETHGVTVQWNEDDLGHFDDLADDPAFENQIVGRVMKMYERDKNRTSVLIWSLGNESGYGRNFAAAAAALKKADPSRLIHYERIWCELSGSYRPAADIDFYSRMYPEIGWLEKFAVRADKPVLLCEYTHAMGNSCGDIADYWKLIDRSPKICGAFVWEWCEQSVLRDGKILYGGDFGEKMHDGNFCLDGIVTTDRRRNPSWYEVKEIYAPCDVFLRGKQVVVRNKNAFSDLSGLECFWCLRQDGKQTASGKLDLAGIPPGGEKAFDPEIPENASGVSLLDFDFRKDGCQTAHRQIILSYRRSPAISEGKLRAEVAPDGMLTRIGDFVFPEAPVVRIVRNSIDNDAKVKWQWEQLRLFDVFFRAETTEVSENQIDASGYLLADAMPPLARMNIRYKGAQEGVLVSLKASLSEKLPPLARFGLVFVLPGDFTGVRYIGRGPTEAYADRHAASPVGYYTADVRTMNHMYSKPQESGSHCDSKAVFIGNGKWEFGIESGQSFSFSASEFSPDDYRPHAFEMKPGKYVYLTLDYKMSGVGSHSCGPRLAEKYCLTEKQISFDFLLSCRKRGESLKFTGGEAGRESR